MYAKPTKLNKPLFALLLLALVVAMAFAIAVPTTQAETSVVTTVRAYVCLTGSDNTQLTPGSTSYKIGSTAYFDDGIENGCKYEDFPAGTTDVEVWTSYNGTASQHVTQDISTQPVFNFQTQRLTLRLETCGGAPLAGGNPRWGHGTTYTTTWFPGGVTGSSAPGETAAEFFPGTYSFEMQYKATAAQRISFSFPTDGQVVTFQTTAVSLNWPGPISYGGATGGSTWFTKPTMELLPGTTRFHFKSYSGKPDYTTDLAVSGCTFNRAINLLKVTDHNGAPIAGATGRGGFGTSYGTWHVAGTTDANGLLADIRPFTSPPTNMSYEAKVNSTTANKTQNVQTDAVFEFQTQLLTVRLETCGSAPLDGGKARWGNGPTFTTRWFPNNPAQPTGTSAPGEVAGEAFPGTYSFEMLYKATADQKLSHNFPVDGSTLTWQTTALTLNYPGSISYGGTTGDSTWFTKPTMELLPGTYKFHFRPYSGNPGFTTDLTIAGCAQTFTVLQVKDENGNGVAGAKAQPACGGSWQTTLAGATDANGILLAELPACTTKVRAAVGNSSQEQTTGQLVAANYTFTTEVLRVNLKDHAGNLITDQTGILKQGGGTWIGLGNFNASGYVYVQTFPVASSRYQAIYNGTSEIKDGTPVTAGAGIQELDFYTGQVFGSCITQYAAGSWRTFTDGMELMPGTYTFKEPSQSGTVTAGGVTNLNCPGTVSFALQLGKKVDICHHQNGLAYHLININRNAVDAHLGHGDGFPGDLVPLALGKIFGADCSIIDPPVGP